MVFNLQLALEDNNDVSLMDPTISTDSSMHNLCSVKGPRFGLDKVLIREALFRGDRTKGVDKANVATMGGFA